MISLIPYPLRVEEQDGTVELYGTVSISHDQAFSAEAAILSNTLSRNKALEVTLNATDLEFYDVLMVVDESCRSEGYRLVADERGVTIGASDGAGIFYGLQTLTNIARETKDGFEVPFVIIEDEPRFPWRGLHLDVGRHMFPVQDIKRLIDRMADLKLNTFHWHLTEDQGWRIEIDAYPELTTIGSRRSGPDGNYDGFYTKDEVRDVVSYAMERHINVVPEIEMPGHTQAVLAAYPNLSCTGGSFDVMDTWGISKEVFCAGNDEVFEFLFRVLDEVIELFPYSHIHIGGDECPKDRWTECDKCAKRIDDEKLADVAELQSWFIRKVEHYLLEKGKSIIGWDEILEGGLAPNAAVMSWRGVEGGITAAKAGHSVVMSPTQYCYLDYPQSSVSGEPGPEHFTTPVLSTAKVYQLEPVPSELDDQEQRHILGAQGNIWTESIPTTERLEYMIFPRICALAEVVWSPAAARDWQSFKERLHDKVSEYVSLGMNVCKDPAKWE